MARKCDPTRDPTCNPENPVGGRICLGGAAGLAFWPRVNETDEGLVKFELRSTAPATVTPLIFVDNIAATTRLAARAGRIYRRGPIGTRGVRRAEQPEHPLRRGDENRRLFLQARAILVCVHWPRGDGTPVERRPDGFETTAILEGAEQPPFYPSVETGTCGLKRRAFQRRRTANVRCAIRRPLRALRLRAEAAGSDKSTNPLEIFLNLRTCIGMGMGATATAAGRRPAGDADRRAEPRQGASRRAPASPIRKRRPPTRSNRRRGAAAAAAGEGRGVAH